MVAHFSHHLVAALLQPLLPFIRDEFALDYTQAGWVVSAFTLAYGISQLPAGWLADRLGPRILITVGISGVALCGLLVGLSPTYIMMVVFLVLLGVMGGGYHPASSPLVSASADEKNRGLALGLHQIGGTASFFLSPLIAVGIAIALGWRGSFIVLAIPTIILGIVLYFFLGRWGFTRKVNNQTPNAPAGTRYTPTRLRRLITFTVLGVALQALIFSTVSFIPLFVVDTFLVSEAVGAGLLSLAHFAGLFAGPVGGFLSDRFGKVPVLLVVSLIAGPAIFLLSQASLNWSIWLVVLVMGTCQYIGMPVSEAYIISHTSERNRSTILGIYYFASRGGPGIIMPALGYLIDRFGFRTSFTAVGAVMLAVTLLCSVLLWGSRDEPLPE